MQTFFDKLSDWLESFVPASFMKYIRTFLSVSFVTFVLIGAVNTLSTSVIATVLDALKAQLSVPENTLIWIERFRITFITGYILSMILSFFLNTYFTFHEKPSWKKAVTFPISYIPNFIIQYTCVWLFTSMHWNHTAAYLIAAVIGIPVTFLTMKLFVYKKK